MVRLFRAGLIAGVRQLIAVAAMTLLISLLAPSSTFLRISAPRANSESFWIAVSPFLAWAYIVVAVGLALTTSKSIDATAVRIHHASRLLRLIAAEYVLVSLVVQFSLSAILLAILAVRAPPELLVVTGRFLGSAAAVSIIWPAMLSVAVACFGATAHAALSAYRLDR
jgi:hypothetical protein